MISANNARNRQSAFSTRWPDEMQRPVPPFALLLFTLIGAPRIHAQDFQTWNEIDFAATWHRIDWLAPALARVDTERPNPQLAANGIMADVHLAGN